MALFDLPADGLWSVGSRTRKVHSILSWRACCPTSLLAVTLMPCAVVRLPLLVRRHADRARARKQRSWSATEAWHERLEPCLQPRLQPRLEPPTLVGQDELGPSFPASIGATWPQVHSMASARARHENSRAACKWRRVACGWGTLVHWTATHLLLRSCSPSARRSGCKKNTRSTSTCFSHDRGTRWRV
jgi:hypothetical protein